MRKVRRCAHLGLGRYAVEGAKVACRAQICRRVEIAGYCDRRDDHGHGYNDQQFQCGKSSLSFVVRYFLHTLRRLCCSESRIGLEMRQEGNEEWPCGWVLGSGIMLHRDGFA